MDAKCTLKTDGMMKICEILAVFFGRMANYFDDILTDIGLWFLCRQLSGHRLAERQNNIIPREKVTTEGQNVTLAQHSV
jgi:hypothetical protein